MTTHFITAEIDLTSSAAKLQQEIQKELEKYGEPLRWAVTKVDVANQKAILEAIVTIESKI